MKAQDWINQYKVRDGFEVDGCFFETIQDLIQIEVFGFCACGMPEENLKYIRDGLEYIDWRINSNDRWEEKKAKELAIFGSEPAAYFFYYWASKENLTEHGGSVPGWLDTKGKLMLDVLKTINLDEDNPEE